MSDKIMYAEEYQLQVLAYMLQNSSFAQVVSGVINIEHFSNRALQWYYQTITESAIPLTPVTLKEELLKAASEKRIKADEVDKVVSYYKIIRQPVVPAEEEHIKTTFSAFAKRQAMKRAILDSAELIKTEQWDEVVARVDSARNTGIDILSLGHNFFSDFEARLAQRQVAEEARKVGTGIPSLDTIMYGGLKNKQLGLVVGGSGRGKSLFLEWLARAAVIMGHQVVYYTLELSEEDIADRFDSLFTRIKPQELKSANDKLYGELHKYHERFGNSLIIKEYPEDEATIHTIKAHYQQLSSIGVRPAMVIIDYLDLMKPHRVYKDVNQEQTAVVKACRGFTKEFNTRVWSALQLNRGGLAQDTPDESGLAGSVSRLYTADAVIMMAQTPDEREDKMMRLVVKKNRNGPSDRVIKINTDFEHMTFYAGEATDTALTESSGALAQAGEDVWGSDDDNGVELNPSDVVLD